MLTVRPWPSVRIRPRPLIVVARTWSTGGPLAFADPPQAVTASTLAAAARAVVAGLITVPIPMLIAGRLLITADRSRDSRHHGRPDVSHWPSALPRIASLLARVCACSKHDIS